MAIEVSGGLTEDEIVVGNTYDKYGSTNPIVKRIMAGFDNSLTQLVEQAEASSIHEVGCGEGYWSLKFLADGKTVRGTDFSETVIKIAQENAVQALQDPSLFSQKSIYDLTLEEDASELVICCEVLEHLEDPEAGLKALQEITEKTLIVSVPREPIWRLLNMARGKYIRDLGNTPGHLQHWSRHGFVKFVSSRFKVEQVLTPLPWTMLLCRPK